MYAKTPKAVTGLAASPDNQSVSLAWDAVDGASGYNVYRSKEKDGPLEMQINRAPAAETSFNDSGLANGVDYYYAVTALAGDSAPFMEGPPSISVLATPSDTVPPITPTGLMVVPGGGFVLLSWEPVSDPDLGGYHVYRGEMSGGDMVRLTDEPIVYITYRDDAALPGVEYEYAVTAVDNSSARNESGMSGKAAATVAARP
jgi:fibronectin type 3 domain-containing protein